MGNCVSASPNAANDHGQRVVAAAVPAATSTRLLRLQIVVHDGRQHDLVGLDEEPRGLQADDQVLAGDDVGLPWPTRVPWPMPQTLIRQVVRFSGMSSATSAVPSCARSASADPEGRVGELRAHGRLDQRRRPAGRRRGGSSPCPAPSIGLPAYVGSPRPWRRRRLPCRQLRHAPSPRLPSSHRAAKARLPVAVSCHRLPRIARLRGTLRSSVTSPPKTPRSAMPTAFGRNEVLEPSPEVGLASADDVPAPPLPEELLDLRHVGAAGDVFERLVVDRHHGRADERLAGQVGQLDLHLGLLARLVRLLRRPDLDVQHPLFGRDDDLAASRYRRGRRPS